MIKTDIACNVNIFLKEAMMALSNIFREPKKEITETIVGIVLVAPFIVLDYYIGRWIETASTSTYGEHTHTALPLPLGMIGGAFIIFLSIIGFVLIHDLGESFIKKWQNRGKW